MDDPSPESLEPLDPGTMGAELPDERVARNETVARRVNETIEDGRVNREGLVGFICECGQLGCNAVVELSLREYETVRAQPRQFAIVAGHDADFDREITRTSRYAIVAKQGRAGVIAESADPRAENT
jgi:hypothetical protein